MKSLMTIFSFLIFASPLFAAPEEELLKKGFFYLDNGNLEWAAKKFEQAVRTNPQSFEAYKGLGLTYFRIGYNEASVNLEILPKSIDALSEAIRLRPDAESYYYLGMAWLALDKKDIANQVCTILNSLDAKKGFDLAARIAAYKTPETYRYLQNDHNIDEEQREAKEESIKQRNHEQARRKAAEQAEKDRLTTSIEEARKAAAGAEYRARQAEAAAESAKQQVEMGKSAYQQRKTRVLIDQNTGAINPRTGEHYSPAGPGYVGTRDGTYYAPAGPNGVINTRTGEYVPMH